MRRKISKLALVSCVLCMWGGVNPLFAKKIKENRFYIVPLQTESFKFDSVDLIGGNVIENRFDIGMDKRFHLLRTYNSNRVDQKLSFGSFSHHFDKKINPKIAYKKERVASKLYKNSKLACENGWKELAPKVFLGKLEELHASFDKKSKLCNVYDEYSNLKITLVVKNKKRKKVISNKLKLLHKADGTEILFYKNSNGTWNNVLNAPMTFSEIDEGYKLILENGNIEIYSRNGKLKQIQSEEKIFTLKYKRAKLVNVSDNFNHEIKFRYNRRGLVKKIVSYDGTEIKYRYDRNKQLKKVIYPDNRMEKYTYDDGKLTNIYLDGLLIKSYTYDNEGRVEKSSGIKESNAKLFTYDKNSINVEENGILTNYNFLITHSQAKIAAVMGDEGAVAYSYDDNAHQLSFTDTLGVTRITSYDKSGLLKKEVTNAGTKREMVTDTEYDESLRRPIVINKSDVVTYQVYNDNGKVTYKVDTLIDENGATTQNKIEHRTYDTQGLVNKVEQGKENQELLYDYKGNTIEVTNHLGLSEKITRYNQSDLPLESIDSEGVVTTTSYNVVGKKTSETKDGQTATMKYDNQARLIEQTSSEDVVSYFKYDDFGNIIETSESTGGKIVYTYDTQQNLLKTEKYNHEILVYKHTKEYDDKRRVTAEIDAYGNSSTYFYNEKGQKVQVTDAKGRSTYYEYDELGKLAKEIDPNGGETTYDYDAKGHTTQIVTPNGAAFTYVYDGFGRLIKESNPDSGVTTYTYDEYDKKLTETDANAHVKYYLYDTLGRMVAIEHEDANLNLYYSYNDKSEIMKVTDASGSTSAVYDKENLLSKTQQIDEQSFTTQYSYTDSEKIATMTYPSATTLSYAYDGDAEMQSISINGEVLLDNIHMKNAQIASYRYTNGTTHTREYDLNERAIKLSYPEYTENLDYDEVSSITAIMTDDSKKLYSYDNLNRLTTYDKNSTAYQYFTYDENGNRLSLEQSISDMTNYIYQANTNILSSLHNSVEGDINYIYDDAGNIVEDGKHTYSYDGRNRLIGVDENVKYEYNYKNQRVSKIVEGTTTYYIYDGHKLLGEYDQEGNAIKEYVYLNDTPVAMITNGNKTYMIYSDHLDSPRRVVDTNHKVVWSWESSPYGENLPAGSLEFNLRFPGQYYDAETGYHYNINRDYNPITGRYMQSDPVGFKGGVNTYGYAEANPVMKRDEMGLWTSGAYYFPKVHQNVNARLWGGYRWFVGVLNRGTVSIDKRQEGHESFLHAMRGLKSKNGRLNTYSEAVVRSENYIINATRNSIDYANRGDMYRSIFEFSWVLHIMQDSTSPAHRGFQVWDGDESYWEIWKHVRKEWSTPSNMNHEVYRASRWIWAMRYYHLIPRHGAIFYF